MTDLLGPDDNTPGGHVRIAGTPKGETWTVLVAVGATLDEVESARAIAREIADRLSGRAGGASPERSDAPPARDP